MAEIFVYLVTASVVAVILGLVAGAVENLPRSWVDPSRKQEEDNENR